MNLLDAARVLVNRIDIIHDDPRYVAVWQMAHAHCGPYTGPTYVQELAALRAAIAAEEARAALDPKGAWAWVVFWPGHRLKDANGNDHDYLGFGDREDAEEELQRCRSAMVPGDAAPRLVPLWPALGTAPEEARAKPEPWGYVVMPISYVGDYAGRLYRSRKMAEAGLCAGEEIIPLYRAPRSASA